MKCDAQFHAIVRHGLACARDSGLHLSVDASIIHKHKESDTSARADRFSQIPCKAKSILCASEKIPCSLRREFIFKPLHLLRFSAQIFAKSG
jgi:hypothetical protein